MSIIEMVQLTQLGSINYMLSNIGLQNRMYATKNKCS